MEPFVGHRSCACQSRYCRLVPQAKGWVRAQHGLLFPQKIGALVAKLVEEGERMGAEIFWSIVRSLPDPRPFLVPEPIGHMDVWHYERVLRIDIAVLVAVVGMPAFKL